ncbi:MAG TPA: hypothetical protein VF013_00050 [Candidatus Limnocylindria bacterium]
MARLVELAQAGDLSGYCRLAGSMCVDFAEERGGAAAIPPQPPLIAGTRVIPSRTSGTAGVAGGQLLVLCGTDGLGRQYRTEMLVSTASDGTLYAINGVYWSNAGLAVSANTGGPTGGAGIDCPDR